MKFLQPTGELYKSPPVSYEVVDNNEIFRKGLSLNKVFGITLNNTTLRTITFMQSEK